MDVAVHSRFTAIVRNIVSPDAIETKKLSLFLLCYRSFKYLNFFHCYYCRHLPSQCFIAILTEHGSGIAARRQKWLPSTAPARARAKFTVKSDRTTGRSGPDRGRRWQHRHTYLDRSRRNPFETRAPSSAPPPPRRVTTSYARVTFAYVYAPRVQRVWCKVRTTHARPSANGRFVPVRKIS